MRLCIHGATIKFSCATSIILGLQAAATNIILAKNVTFKHHFYAFLHEHLRKQLFFQAIKLKLSYASRQAGKSQ